MKEKSPAAALPPEMGVRIGNAAPNGGAARGFRSGRSGHWNFRFDSDSACSSLCFRFLPQKFPFFFCAWLCPRSFKQTL